jgi:hypothetical protein
MKPRRPRRTLLLGLCVFIASAGAACVAGTADDAAVGCSEQLRQEASLGIVR